MPGSQGLLLSHLMIRLLGFLIVVLAMFGLSWQFINQRVPAWEAEMKYLVEAATQAGADQHTWSALTQRADTNLPGFYPFSVVHNVLNEGYDLSRALDDFRPTPEINWELSEIPASQFDSLWNLFDQVETSLARINRNARSLPRWWMSDSQKTARDNSLAQIEIWQRYVKDLRRLERVFKEFQGKEDRVLILLQNRNEPRPTGGFVGSLILLDFFPEKVTWRFLDIYELDRLLTVRDQLPAPEWFHDLSKMISLRDANFWPDFRTSSQQYRQMFEAIGQKPPRTVVGINLSVIETLLHLTGPVTIEPWGVELNEQNFDLVLQFLVESKISGRFSVKQPIMQFAQKLMSPTHLRQLNVSRLRAFDWEEFWAEKHILAHSQNVNLQKLIERWSFDGQIRRKVESDNFLQFDFVSIGANKSDKFVWTKLWHDSEIFRDGRVHNTVKIKRTHSLQPNEINDLLGTNAWTPNVRDLLSPDLYWKLGAGENRIVLRVMTPVNARLLSQKNPSGAIRSTVSNDKKYKIWAIPLNVVPAETLEAEFTYETVIDRGSQRWRPYFLQLLGTPARDKTSLIKTISTERGGKFSAQTSNIGRPEPLVDQDFRAVIEFQ